MCEPNEIQAANTVLNADELRAMKTKSLLVARELSSLRKQRPEWKEADGLNFSWIPRRRAFSKFIQLCKSQQPIDLSISELYELQVICDEWECPEIESSVTSFLKRTQTGEQLLDRFCEQKFQPRGLRKLVACHFAELANLTGVFRLTPKVLVQIMNEEECRFPPQNRLSELVGVFLHKYKRQAVGLVKFLDFGALDLERAVPIYNALDELDMMGLFPKIRAVVKKRLTQHHLEDKKKDGADLSEPMKIRAELISKNNDWLQQLEEAKRDYLEAADDYKKKTGCFADPPNISAYDLDQKGPKRPVIAVHSGKFHADDVLAVYLLKEVDRYKYADVIRTRDQKQLAQCDIVCDVGGEYDHARGRYDHHQNGFETCFPGSKIVSASCGLVYYHYGREVIQKLITENKWIPSLKDDDIDTVWKLHYKFFVEELDAQDNGVKMASEKAKYYINTSLAARIGRMNLCKPGVTEDAAFLQAVEVMGKEFRFFLKYLCCVKLPLYARVRKAFEDMGKTRIMDLGYSPRRIWFHEELRNIEKEFRKEGQVLYVITKRGSGNNGKDGRSQSHDFRWVVQAANSKESMTPRKPLPFANLELADQRRLCEEKCGITDLEFLHKTGFMAVFKSEKSAREFAKYAVTVDDKDK